MGARRIAKVLKANGVDGGMLVSLLDGAPETMNNGEPVTVVFDGLPVPFFIESFTPKGASKAIIHITDVTDLKSAEELVGLDIFSGEGEADEEEEDFSGWTLFDREEKVGVVDGLEPIPGNPCLRIGELLVPLHEDFIDRLDKPSRSIFMHLPEGLR